ncbi:uncharacterized protein ACBR49_007221 [Aulostomus maculatus]
MSLKNMLSNQCFTMLMFVSVLYATSHTDKSLERVVEEVGELLNKSNALNRTFVPKFQYKSCKDDFFCLAEKALGNVTNLIGLDDIKRNLQQYIRVHNKTCHRNTTSGEFLLRKLLENIRTCANQVLNHQKERST